MKNKAFTTVEMLVTLIIVLILILAMGVISSTSLDLNRKQRVGLDTYSDVHYAFKYMENKIRSASLALTVSTPGGAWQGSRLNLGSGANDPVFGVYINGTKRELAFVPNRANVNVRDTMLTIDTASSSNNSLTLGITPSTITSTVTLQVSGINEKFKFDLKDTIMKRSQ